MLLNLAFVLIVLWIVGMVSSYTMGGLIHVLLVVAIVAVAVTVIRGRRPPDQSTTTTGSSK